MRGTADKVFVIEGNDLRALPGRPWRIGLFGRTLEDALQSLVEKHPDVLPGHQMDPASDDPPRFVLLRREMTLGIWSVDHLLVDQRGVLTLVETKLVENSEARREVIGQIMEYASNAAESWGNGRVRKQAAEFWSKSGKDVDEVIQAKFGVEVDVEAFWRGVEENLREGKIRLIIVADELRSEVRRIIEYLNGEMRTAEIYGLELRCYSDEAQSIVLVPRLIGQTQATLDRKGVPESTTLWTVDRLRSAYDGLPDVALRKHLRSVLNWAVDQGFFMEARAKTPIFALRGQSGARIVTFSPDWTYCYLNEKSYFGAAGERDRLVAELKSLGMYDRDFNPQGVLSGRNLVRKLTELGEDEIRRLLEVFSPHCSTAART